MKPSVAHWISFLAVFQLTCSSSFCFASDSKSEPAYRAMTYNIRYANTGDKQDQWANRKEAVVKTILGADVVGLQEVLSVQQEYIQSQTPGWQWWAVGRDDGQHRGEMCSVGWNSEKFTAVEKGVFWLSPSPFRIGEPGWDAALPRIASWVRLIPRTATKNRSEKEAGAATSIDSEQSSQVFSLLLVNAHFDHRGAESRRQSAVLLRRWIAEHRGDSDVLLLGDLNAKRDSPPLKELLDTELSSHPALVDARDLAPNPDPGPDSTWNGFREIVAGQRIDHVLVIGQSLTITDYQTLDPRTSDGRFASDHLPVMVQFSFSDD